MADASVRGSICSGPIDENRNSDPATMRIGGFVPFTSIDYPGELAAVVFCQGCPWRCSYCHNPHLLDARSTELLDWQALLEVLSLRKGLLDAVVFSGGEPTLQDTLPGAITEVKKMGFTGRRHLNRLSPGHTLTSLIQDLGVVRFPGLKRDIRSIGLQKAAEWRFAMIIGHAGAWPITIGPDDGPGLRYQRRKTASACAGWAAKWRIMLAMDCRG